jgi:hypothetical protein
MKAAALFDLPVHAGTAAVEPLQPVHAQVAGAVFRVGGVHQRQGEKGPPSSGQQTSTGRRFRSGAYETVSMTGPF